ncbi:Pentatricopeptide repeat-containing protein [Sesamum angolense]|uniref:Pentatricopeptide repeat-containing protein n=1 Tax=Sesamum angolense TaxID=2727404 RepID=A0AAE1T3D4_9LAMI|nr:Pentatricopeptide repeat-containing protein [Sesamum angolense]
MGITPDVWSYNTLMHCFFKLGKPDEAYRIFHDILLKNSSPCQSTFNILISGLCKNGYTGNALSLFRNLQRHGYIPEIMTYNILINSLCKSGRWKDVMRLFEELRESGHDPNAITYTTVMKCCFRCKHFREGLEAGGKMPIICIAHMIKIGYELDMASYNTLINWHCKEGKLENAYSLLNLAEERGLDCDKYTHTILIDGLCKAGNIDAAQRHLNHMKMLGFNCVVAFNCFIDGLCKVGHLDYALKIFHSMDVKDSFTYSSLVHNLCKARRYRLAAELLLSCIKAGMKVLKSDQNAVIKGLTFTGSKRDVEKFKLKIRIAKLLHY